MKEERILSRSFQNLIAYEWRSEDWWKVIVANIATGVSQARIQLGEQVSSARQHAFFDELREVRYLRSDEEIVRPGLYVRLDAFQAHLFGFAPA